MIPQERIGKVLTHGRTDCIVPTPLRVTIIIIIHIDQFFQ
jgi:hypothetical protein